MISFIVIGRNEGWRLEKCLLSIRTMADRELTIPYEIIYVDSQSTDNSLELSKKYVDKSFLITGICNAAIGRNIGANESNGDILFFIDGDMELRENVLPTIVSPQGKLIYPFVSGVEYDYLYDENWNLKSERVRRHFISGLNTLKVTTGGLFVIERPLWEEVMGMDNRLRCNEDMDFGIRVNAIGYPLMRMGQLWVNHYTILYSVRRNELRMCKYPALFFRKHFFEKTVHRVVFRNNYSCYLLLLTLLFPLLIHSLPGLLIFIPYFLLAAYRGYKVYKMTSAVSFVKVVCIRILKDLIMIYSFFCYYPKQPHVLYTRL